MRIIHSLPFTLAFEGHSIDIIDRDGNPWLRGSQIATPLGYKKGQRVTELYTRHADEFTAPALPQMDLFREGLQ